MTSQDILTLSAVPAHVASRQNYEVPGEWCGIPTTVLLAC